MERTSRLHTGLFTMACSAILLSASIYAAPKHPLHPQLQYQDAPTTPYIIPPQNTAETSSQALPENYDSGNPQPLMRGEGFNYHLYYNYRLTPHIILRPNLQQSTKPGAVSDHSQRFVGGLGAGINF